MTKKNLTLTKREEIFFRLKYITKQFRADFQARLNDYGLTAQQGRVLFFINFRKSNNLTTRLVDIEKRFNLTKSTVHGLVTRMIKANFLFKVRYTLELTDYSKSIIHVVKEKRKECLENFFQNLTDDETSTLSTLLNKICVDPEVKEANK
ncbi:MAG: MarR family transcriptional regulator [Erysipelotrichia bacterium]|nr:MarR family transcriptional regulator [Erysipelotrichia bacterium]